MKIIGQHIIEYLKGDSTLTTLIGGPNNIFAVNIQDRKDTYIVVSTDGGKDGNNIPSQEGNFTVECVVSRKTANAHKICIDIAKRIDDILNKHENLLATIGWNILHLLRVETSGLLMDSDTQEFYFTLTYDYILGEYS